MKNISLLLNIVLLAAVAFLYYKVFNDSPNNNTPVFSGNGMPAEAIVFVNSDTLLADYNLFNEAKKSLESKQDSIDVLLTSKAKALESDVNDYQNRAAGMSPDQRASTEEKLMARQQGLMELKQSLLEELQNSESALNDTIHNNLSKFLKEYNKGKNYLYILGYQRGSGILLANDSLDITKEVLEGLNNSK